MQTHFVILATLVCLAVALPSQITRIQNINHHNRVPGEYLVVLKSTNTDVNINTYVSHVADKFQAVSKKIDVLNTFSAFKSPIMHIKVDDEETAAALLRLPEVDSIEADVFEKKIEQCYNQNSGSNLWGLSRVSSRSMPNLSTGYYSFKGYDGYGVRVYVLDTGIRITHSDFAGRAVWGANTIGGGNNDVQGHGTHCAGTVAGSTYGGSKATTVVAVKVLSDSGSGSNAAIINGINWAVNDALARRVPGVLSMSLGGGASTSIDSAVNQAVLAGITAIVAAGNDNRDACYYSPARATNAITVGATDEYDSLSSFSNWGQCVDILAPGSRILSASAASDTGAAFLSGTSMATPLVAAEAANYLSAYPSATPSQVKSYLLSSASQNYINLRGLTNTPNLLLHATC